MDLTRRHLPWKIERQLRDLGEQFRRQQITSAWTRFALALMTGIPVLGLVIHLLANTPIPLILPLGIFLIAIFTLWWRWVYRAALVEPTREQIALYIDEHHPDLENLAITSVSFSDTDGTTASDWLLDQFFEQARSVATVTSVQDLVNHRGIRRQLIGLAAVWVLVLVAGTLLVNRWDLEWIGSELFVRSGPTPVSLSIEPGDVRVRHGEDQVVWLTTEATSETVAIRWRVEGGAWLANALQPSASDNVYYHTFTDIQLPIAYQIQAAGSQSAVYQIEVWTPPEVAWIDAVYTYPDYTGLPDRAVSAISTIEAPLGTAVALTVHANQPVSEGELTFVFGQPLSLSHDGPNTLVGEIEVGADDTFRVALATESGLRNVDDRPYAVTARWDEVPEIRIQFPRGDDEATPIEEIPFAFTIKDDFGIWKYGIQYEIAGREPVRRVLGERSQSERSVESSDMLMLEHLDLEPGDFLTWYVWADDGNPSRAPYDQMSDPFFLEIRPFARAYAEAVSNAGQQGGGQGESASDQKQVIIATWNLRKSAGNLVEPEFDERRSAIVTAQREVLAAALESADMAPESFEVIQRVRASADEAVDALSGSTWQDPGEKLSEALRHEQVVHQLLLSLVPPERMVGQGRTGSGGGGGGQANRNLDALELTRRRDFSEEASTQNERLSQTEAVRKGIEDLAKRQTFINQDVAELTSELERGEEDKKDELGRRLQRLIDEQRRNLSELDALNGEVAAGDLDREQTRQTREGLSEAGRQMRQTLRNLEEDRVQRARSSGSNALRELSEVEDQLGSLSQEAAVERLARLAESMDELEEQQNEILESVRQKQDRTPGLLSLDGPRHDPLLDQKEALSRSFENFMNEAGELAEASEARQGLASQKLNDWLRETSREGIHEDMEQGKKPIREGVWDVSERQENRVLTKLKDARERLETVTDALVANELDGMRQALEQVQQLVPGGEAGDAPPLSTPGHLSEFLEGDYRNWVEGLRAAESLLPDGDIRRELSGVREEVDRVRRRFQRDKVPPRFDLVYDRITRPLQHAAESLQEEIARESGEYAVGIERIDTVPERYREQVADYFKALSEIDVREGR